MKFSARIYGLLTILGIVFLALVLLVAYLDTTSLLGILGGVLVFLSFPRFGGFFFVLVGIAFLTVGIVGIIRRYFEGHGKLLSEFSIVFVPLLTFVTFIFVFSLIFFVYLLFFAIGVSIVVGFYELSRGRPATEFMDAVVILIILVLNAILGFYQEFKAEKAVESLKKMAPHNAKVKRGGKVREIDVRDVVPGDIIKLDEGDKIC